MKWKKLLSARVTTLLILLFGIVFGGMLFSFASESGNCSPEKNNSAVSLLIKARETWPSLLKHQRIYASCDDGELGEDYSDAVVHLFAARWDQLSLFFELSRKYPTFQHWAIQHIDATASEEDLNKIIKNTDTCGGSVGAVKLCKNIRIAAKNALDESK